MTPQIRKLIQQIEEYYRYLLQSESVFCEYAERSDGCGEVRLIQSELQINGEVGVMVLCRWDDNNPLRAIEEFNEKLKSITTNRFRGE